MTQIRNISIAVSFVHCQQIVAKMVVAAVPPQHVFGK
jgi:hypothetical protein